MESGTFTNNQMLNEEEQRLLHKSLRERIKLLRMESLWDEPSSCEDEDPPFLAGGI